MGATIEDTQTAFDALQRRAPRMYLQDLQTLEILEAQFNPSKLNEVLAVDWNRLVSPGNSHRRMQYNYTDNHKITFELIFDALQAGNTASMADARKFLFSVCYAKKGSQSIREGEATRVLFVWPALFTMTCVVTNVSIEHTAFNLAGQPSFSTAKLAIEEIRDVRLFSEDVRQNGTQRTSASSQANTTEKV
jgi:hypothetical protein